MTERVVTADEARGQDTRELLRKHGLDLKIRLSPQQSTPPWGVLQPRSVLPQHYRITFTASDTRKPRVIQFDFWGSINDAAHGRSPTEFDIICGINSDFNRDGWDVKEYMDSLCIPRDQAERINRLALKLTTFFTETERDAMLLLEQESE